MAQVKSRGNKSTELALIEVLKANRITGWRRNYPLEGNPDFVFVKNRVAIFVDGCFWHGHPVLCRFPESNREYWEAKIQRNRARDKRVNKALKRKGWIVLRIWEHDIKKKRTLTRIKKALQINDFS